MPYGAIFDMDGVLVDSGDAHRASWMQLGDEVGVAFTPELFVQTFGMHNNQIIPLWLGEVTADEVERLALRKEVLYRAAAPDVVRPLPGAVSLVRALRAAGWRLAVASSGPRANVALIVRLLALEDAFDALITGDDVHEGKPHPEVFQKAIAAVGLPPSACVVIEDAPQGVSAGLAAGAAVLAVTTSRPAIDLAAAHRVVDSLETVTPDALHALIVAQNV